MKLSLRMDPEPDARWELAQQMGIEHAVLNLPETDGDTHPWEFKPLQAMVERVEDAGFTPQVIEERPPMDNIRLGQEGRDEEVEYVKTLLRNMGELGIPVWCWVWRTHFPVLRTSRQEPVRGGSTVTAYNHETMQQESQAEVAPVSEEQLWENLEYFLNEVVPVAEEAGVKMALHPSDPPTTSDIRGVARIITSVEGYDRALSLYPSEHNGVTFCQGNFAAMGADIPETIRHYGDKIHFVHFRDIEGTAEDFREAWHDNGPTDMFAAMRAYRETGFDGPIRPDHYPEVHLSGVEDLEAELPGLMGRLFGVAYTRGLLEASESQE